MKKMPRVIRVTANCGYMTGDTGLWNARETDCSFDV